MADSVLLETACKQGCLIITRDEVSLRRFTGLRRGSVWALPRGSVSGASSLAGSVGLDITIHTLGGRTYPVGDVPPAGAVGIISLLGYAYAEAPLRHADARRSIPYIPCKGGALVIGSERVIFMGRRHLRRTIRWSVARSAISGVTCRALAGSRLLHALVIYTIDGAAYVVECVTPHDTLAVIRALGYVRLDPPIGHAAPSAHPPRPQAAEPQPWPETLPIAHAKRPRARQRQSDQLNTFWQDLAEPSGRVAPRRPAETSSRVLTGCAVAPALCLLVLALAATIVSWGLPNRRAALATGAPRHNISATIAPAPSPTATPASAPTGTSAPTTVPLATDVAARQNHSRPVVVQYPAPTPQPTTPPPAATPAPAVVQVTPASDPAVATTSPATATASQPTATTAAPMTPPAPTATTQPTATAVATPTAAETAATSATSAPIAPSTVASTAAATPTATPAPTAAPEATATAEPTATPQATPASPAPEIPSATK